MTTVSHRWAKPELILRDEKDQRSKESKVVKPINVLPDKVLTSEPILKPPEAIQMLPNTDIKPEFISIDAKKNFRLTKSRFREAWKVLYDLKK